jgi:hypothetical protein
MNNDVTVSPHNLELLKIDKTNKTVSLCSQHVQFRAVVIGKIQNFAS